MEKPAHLIVFDHKIFDLEDSAFEGLKIGLRQTKLAKNATCIRTALDLSSGAFMAERSARLVSKHLQSGSSETLLQRPFDSDHLNC